MRGQINKPEPHTVSLNERREKPMVYIILPSAPLLPASSKVILLVFWVCRLVWRRIAVMLCLGNSEEISTWSTSNSFMTQFS